MSVLNLCFCTLLHSSPHFLDIRRVPYPTALLYFVFDWHWFNINSGVQALPACGKPFEQESLSQWFPLPLPVGGRWNAGQAWLSARPQEEAGEARTTTEDTSPWVPLCFCAKTNKRNKIGSTQIWLKSYHHLFSFLQDWTKECLWCVWWWREVLLWCLQCWTTSALCPLCQCLCLRDQAGLLTYSPSYTSRLLLTGTVRRLV